MRTAKRDLENFFRESTIWTDICDELDQWVADNHLMLEDTDGTMKLEDFKHHAAICTALRRVKHVGDYMMTDESLQQSQEDSENGNIEGRD